MLDPFELYQKATVTVRNFQVFLEAVDVLRSKTKDPITLYSVKISRIYDREILFDKFTRAIADLEVKHLVVNSNQVSLFNFMPYLKETKDYSQQIELSKFTQL